VAGGAGPGAAETYLRLLAEAELRRSLAYPRYQPPEQRGRWPPARAAAAASPSAARLVQAARMRWPAAAAAAARLAAGPAWSRLGWATRHVRWRSHRVRPRRHHQQALPGVHQVRQAASALVAAEAISETAAQSVLYQLTGALAARAKIAAGPGAGPIAGWWPGGALPGRPGPVPALPAGLIRARPVGAAVPLGPDGSLGTTWVLALVLAPDRASLTTVTRLTGSDPFRERPRPGRPWQSPVHDLGGHLAVTDSQGTHCQVASSAGQASDHAWSSAFDLHPVPVPGARWVDITFAPGAAPVRVGLTAPAGGQPQASPAACGLLPSAGGPAGRPLDELAERLLRHAAQGGPASPDLLAGLPGIAAALQAAGVLAPGSAALGRLAALAGRLGVPFPASLRHLAGPAGLPAAWLSVLDRLGRADGPARDAPVAAVLPEVDGARFALSGLRSAADSATVHALAWGWAPDRRALGGERFSWWARDDGGRWQLAAPGGSSYGGGQVDVDLRFVPPLHPSARSLDFFLVGPASQATVSVPLDWVASG